MGNLTIAIGLIVIVLIIAGTVSMWFDSLNKPFEVSASHVDNLSQSESIRVSTIYARSKDHALQKYLIHSSSFETVQIIKIEEVKF